MEEQKEKRMNWAEFVETIVVKFFQDNELEKLTVEDGNGNKAKLIKQKDCGIKLEYTSTTML